MVEMKPVQRAAQELGRAHRELRHARAQSDRGLDAIVNGWVDDHEDLVEDETGEYLDDALVKAAKEFLLTGVTSEENVDDELRAALQEGRHQLADQMQAAMRPVEVAAAEVVGPYRAFSAAVREWLRESREHGDISDWPTILELWRDALSLTTREAAAALDVSASAIARYLGRTRSPSIPQVVAMVEAMTSWDPRQEDSKFRAAARRLAKMFGEDPDMATEILEDAGSWRTELEGVVHDALDSLNRTQLAVLAALATAPKLLDGLATFSTETVFNDVQAAVAAVRVGREGSQ